MTEWIKVGSLDDIPIKGARKVATQRGTVAVFRCSDDAVFALLDRCPHKAGPLSEGIVHGHRVTCPLHNWVIELEDGNAVAPDVGCAPKLAVRVEDGVIWLQAEAAQNPAAA